MQDKQHRDYARSHDRSSSAMPVPTWISLIVAFLIGREFLNNARAFFTGSTDRSPA